jgi:hypothetical protein
MPGQKSGYGTEIANRNLHISHNAVCGPRDGAPKNSRIANQNWSIHRALMNRLALIQWTEGFGCPPCPLCSLHFELDWCSCPAG